MRYSPNGLPASRLRPLPYKARRALPARFRRERVLIIGCGDVGLRMAHLFLRRGARADSMQAQACGAAPRWLAATSQAQRIPLLRAVGITPVLADLDRADSLRRLVAWPTRVAYLAPPQAQGLRDVRAAGFVQQGLRARAGYGGRAGWPWWRSLAYVSTTGVYGDCQGAWVDECTPVRPVNARAVRRVDAEQRMRGLIRAGVPTAVLRAPGIYAPDRAKGSPEKRLRSAQPVLEEGADVYTNRIHADDLARAVWLAVWRVRGARVFNVNDDDTMKTGAFYDVVADMLGLPHPPRVGFAQAERTLGDSRMSFLRESRRLSNARIKKELRLQWRYPGIAQGLHASCLLVHAGPS